MLSYVSSLTQLVRNFFIYLIMFIIINIYYFNNYDTHYFNNEYMRTNS